jgi:enoyl-CoA hydratase
MTTLLNIAEQDTHVVLTMDDSKANALSFDMFDALNAGLDAAAQAQKVVVITGRPGRFSAGFDLSVMSRADESTMRLLRTGAALSQRLLTFDTPVVLAVSGHALAMGALLCLSADYRIGVRGNFKIGLNEVAIGMTLPWFGVELARDRLAGTYFGPCVGLAKICDPDTAVEAGFLDEAVDEEAFAERVADTAAGLSQLDMPAHRGSKARVREVLFARLEEALQRDFADAGLATGT